MMVVAKYQKLRVRVHLRGADPTNIEPKMQQVKTEHLTHRIINCDRNGEVKIF